IDGSRRKRACPVTSSLRERHRGRTAPPPREPAAPGADPAAGRRGGALLPLEGPLGLPAGNQRGGGPRPPRRSQGRRYVPGHLVPTRLQGGARPAVAALARDGAFLRPGAGHGGDDPPAHQLSDAARGGFRGAVARASQAVAAMRAAEPLCRLPGVAPGGHLLAAPLSVGPETAAAAAHLQPLPGPACSATPPPRPGRRGLLAPGLRPD